MMEEDPSFTDLNMRCTYFGGSRCLGLEVASTREPGRVGGKEGKRDVLGVGTPRPREVMDLNPA